ncbi:hypothetical protein STEG23_005136 [Scotinomys teguina]
MSARSTRKPPWLSLSKKRNSTPYAVEMAVPSGSVKKREQAAALQTKSPEKLGQDKQGHQGVLTQKVVTEKPNEAFLGLQEKVETSGKPQGNSQTSGLVMVAMATRLSVAQQNESLSGPVTSTLSTPLSMARETQISPDPTTTAMRTHLTLAREVKFIPDPTTTPMSTCWIIDRKSPTTMTTQLASHRKNTVPSCLVTRATATCLTVVNDGPVTTAMAAGLAVTRKSQLMSHLTTAPTATHLVAAKKPPFSV